MKKLLKNRYFSMTIVVLITAFVLWLTLKDDFNDVMELLLSADIRWVIVVFGMVVLYQVLIGLILVTLTRTSKKDYRITSGIKNAFIASFFHGITPSASGGQLAQVYVFKKDGVPISDSASILWMDFILYQATMVVTMVVFLLLRFNYFYYEHSSFFALVLIGFGINTVVIFGLWAIARFKKFYTWVSTTGINIGHKLRLVKDKEKTLLNLETQLERFESETKKLQGNKKILFTVIPLNVLRLLAYYSVPFFCAKALGVTVSLNEIVSILALSSFVSMINAFIPIPGASGGTEATYVLMFSTVFGKLGAKSTMILWRFATYYFVMLIGGLMFIVLKATDKGEEKEK